MSMKNYVFYLCGGCYDIVKGVNTNVILTIKMGHDDGNVFFWKQQWKQTIDWWVSSIFFPVIVIFLLFHIFLINTFVPLSIFMFELFFLYLLYNFFLSFSTLGFMLKWVFFILLLIWQIIPITICGLWWVLWIL